MRRLGDPNENVHRRLSEKEQKIFEERSKQFLDATFGNEQTGLAWTGIIQNYFRLSLPEPIPSHVVLLMLAAHKICRAALPTPIHHDSYDDAKVYVELAREAHPKKEMAQNPIPVPVETSDEVPHTSSGVLTKVCECGHKIFEHESGWSYSPGNCMKLICDCTRYREVPYRNAKGDQEK